MKQTKSEIEALAREHCKQNYGMRYEGFIAGYEQSQTDQKQGDLSEEELIMNFINSDASGLISDKEHVKRIIEFFKNYLSPSEDKYKWVSVEERSPEDYQEVLIYCLTKEGMQVLTARYCDDYDFSYTIHNYNRKMGSVKDIVITHWKPYTTPTGYKSTQSIQTTK